MKIYSLTSTAFSGEVIFEFDDAGNLVSFDMKGAELSQAQQTWILRSMPKHLAHVLKVLGDSKTATLTEIKQEVTFDLFWNRYNLKDRSSKKRTVAKWNRMSRADQVRAFNHISKYELTLKPGVDKKYAESYLNAELWNN